MPRKGVIVIDDKQIEMASRVLHESCRAYDAACHYPTEPSWGSLPEHERQRTRDDVRALAVAVGQCAAAESDGPLPECCPRHPPPAMAQNQKDYRAGMARAVAVAILMFA